MTSINNIYNEKEIKIIYEHIEKYEFENIINDFLCEWLKTSEIQIILLEKNCINGYLKVRIVKRFVDILGKYILKQEDFTWENYCKIIHEIPLKKNSEVMHVSLRLMLRSIYIHTLDSATITDLKVKSFISLNINLFLAEEFRRFKTSQYSITYKNANICTNFPLNSTSEQIIQVEYFHNDGSSHFANFYFPTSSQFLLNVMKSVLELISKRKLNNVHNRVIVTLFVESLGGQEFNKFEDFNENTFKQQLLYFNSFSEFINPSSNLFLRQFLVRFYRYIDDIYLEENGVRLFSSFSFNRTLIIHKHYLKSIIEGYEIINLNSLGTCPESDKWLVVPDRDKYGIHISNSRNFLMNFELVNNLEFRDELKGYLWGMDLSFNNIRNHFSVLVEFLNEADIYYQKELQVLRLNSAFSDGLRPFSNRFLIFYYSNLVSNLKYKATTINHSIKSIRRFMKYIQRQYNIPNLMIEQFTSINVDYKGGTPISREDFKEIQREFEWKFKDDGIMLIILQLAIETKMRPGEILALERDCILSIDDSGKFGTIKYYEKSSGRKKKKEVLIIEHIRLLQEAIKISHPLYEKAENSLNKYIFLCRHQCYKNQIIAARNPFNKAFLTISKKLFDQGKIKLKYTPYNLRDTYIDRAWQMVEDGLISTFEVGIITGNSVAVAAKHYREKENTKRYVEALYKVSILDDEISGSIVNSETVNNLPPVQGGAGNCSSESCIKVDTDEDSFYKCLTCKKFVTTVERCSFFEERMKIYKERKDNSKSIDEGNFYNVLIELYGSYLVEIYSILEGEM